MHLFRKDDDEYFTDEEDVEAVMVEAVMGLDGIIVHGDDNNDDDDDDNADPSSEGDNDVSDEDDSESGDDFNPDDEIDYSETNEDNIPEDIEVNACRLTNRVEDNLVDIEEAEEEEEDGLLKAFAEARKVNHVSPPDIRFRSHVTDLTFHPADELVAISSVTGDAFIYRYSVEQCELVSTLELHSRSCDGIEYSEDGDWIATFGRDKRIMISDSTTGSLTQFYDDAHESAISSLNIINENTFCSGDEDGTVCVWDTRKKTKIHSYKVGNDQVSCLLSKDKIIVSCCGDSLHAYCTSRKKSWQSDLDYPDADLSCMCLMKQEKKLLVGTVKGDMLVFNWNEFGLNCDQLRHGKTSISALLPVTEDILLVAEGAGLTDTSTTASIRASSVYPHQQLGVVGQHDVSVERLDISHDGSWAGSVGCDETMRFWNIGYFEDIKVKTTKARPEHRRNNLPSSRVRNPGEFFAGLE